MLRRTGLLLLPFLLVWSARAASAPALPVILEPERDDQIVHAADVHMVTAAFADVDGDQHLCTDWVIRAGDDVVWEARCVAGAEKIHVHLGDGEFRGPRAGKRELAEGVIHVLSARHRDDSGDPATEWSPWAERTFLTSIPAQSPPMSVRDVLATPPPQWTLSPPSGATLRLQTPDGADLLVIGDDGVIDAEPQHTRSAVRVLLGAPTSSWDLPESELTFEDENGAQRTIYLPALQLQSGGDAQLWVSANGGTHHAERGSRVPDFETILRGAPVPWVARQRGFVVEAVAGDLQLPVAIAFVPHPGDGPDAPLYYVAELYGEVKVVTRGGEVQSFASDLLDIMPTGHFPGSGESGLGGIAVDPVSGDVFVTGVYWPDRTIWGLHPRVLRLRASEDGLRAVAVETVIAFVDEAQAPSHQISNISFGPDGMLYVHVGDGAVHETAQDMTSIRGKILRLDRDGTPPPDNPFYDPAGGIDAADYVYALGLRNPFGGAWRAADQSLYSVENGPTTDRLAKIVAGRNYLWDGTDASMRSFALHTWESPTAPVQIAFVQPETFGGSGFPRRKWDSAFVTESGPTWASGVQTHGKRITEVVLGVERAESAPLIEYDGTGKATVAGIAAGPDGLYFTGLYRDYGYEKAIDRGAQVFRVRWAGYADFAVRPLSADGRLVQFDDRSSVSAAEAWSWDFGDGTFSSERAPAHSYASAGAYLVRLTVTGPEGSRHQTKKVWVGPPSAPLTAEYFADPDFATLAGSGTAASLRFDWTAGSPHPALPADGFSVRWSGMLRPRVSETYRFAVRSKDRVRVTVGGLLVVDGWKGNRDLDETTTIDLEAGHEYPIVVEYRHDSGDASIEVLWESATQSAFPVPRSDGAPKRRASRP